jgi:hypothetical protein
MCVSTRRFRVDGQSARRHVCQHASIPSMHADVCVSTRRFRVDRQFARRHVCQHASITSTHADVCVSTRRSPVCMPTCVSARVDDSCACRQVCQRASNRNVHADLSSACTEVHANMCVSTRRSILIFFEYQSILILPIIPIDTDILRIPSFFEYQAVCQHASISRRSIVCTPTCVSAHVD